MSDEGGRGGREGSVLLLMKNFPPLSLIFKKHLLRQFLVHAMDLLSS